ncbi:hypothetical protein FAZ78_02195 [Cereibacter changlensis]|uniref:Uncharacterized protein n=1 Tax=Cereibacter changlensis TaxID=402884 RepID=A0A4U0Z485_9RHOB|nr:hypothetical protein [Cereibacter changlensis]TKA98189.1 hypothetical protein FAZ78_02195 [Cereibacter changlensis]
MGDAVFGWLLWQHADIWIEAHHHAVLQTQDGRLVDLTPQPDGEAAVLFLTDPSKPFDFDNPKPFRKSRKCISKIREHIAWCDALSSLEKFLWQKSKFVAEHVEVAVERGREMQRYERLMSKVELAERAAMLVARRTCV